MTNAARLLAAALPSMLLFDIAWQFAVGQDVEKPVELTSASDVDMGTPGFHMGVRIGEVTSHSAVLWTRYCSESRVDDGPQNPPNDWNGDLSLLNGFVPGTAATIHFRLLNESTGIATETTPLVASDANDFTAKATVTSLASATTYTAVAVAIDPDGNESRSKRHRFTTAPNETEPAQVKFAVLTGQEYRDRDDGANGFLAYQSMKADRLNFLVFTGDSVYYDRREFLANSRDKMRHFWHRMFSFPHALDFFETTPTYFELDDHDILDNDCWPNQSRNLLTPMTMTDGLQIFREQTPSSDEPFRSVRWGADLEVWLLEGRLYRSPNNAPDGPDKSIWGSRQREWLQKSLSASDATFRVVVSPTPVVGPDRGRKNDNHANVGFQHEGEWFRALIGDSVANDVIICCGDRHWQYHSIDPAHAVHEFSCGPLSDAHAAGAPKEQPDWQVFRRVKGGYLTVNVDRPGGTPTLTIEHRAVDGSVAYRWQDVSE